MEFTIDRDGRILKGRSLIGFVHKIGPLFRVSTIDGHWINNGEAVDSRATAFLMAVHHHETPRVVG